MKTPTNTSLLLAACLWSVGCSSPAPGTEAVEPPPALRADDDPIADAAGPTARARAARETVPVADAGAGADVAIDTSGTAAFVARNQAAGALALPPVYTFLSAFVRPGHTLDATGSAAVNAAAIAAEIATQNCPAGTVTYVGGTAYVTAELGTGCTFSGARRAASGTVLVGVTTTNGRVLVRLELMNVSIDGYTVDGYALMSNDGVNERFDTRLALAGLGTILFQGIGTSDGVNVTVVGNGTWDGAVLSAAAPSSGWRCTSSSRSTLAFRGIQRTASDCFATGGTLDVVTAYACTAEGSAPIERRTLMSTSSVQFLPTTPTTGGVAVSVKVPGGSAADAEAVTTALPASLCSP